VEIAIRQINTSGLKRPNKGLDFLTLGRRIPHSLQTPLSPWLVNQVATERNDPFVAR